MPVIPAARCRAALLTLLLGLLTMAISISGVPARYLDLVGYVLTQLRALTPT